MSTLLKLKNLVVGVDGREVVHVEDFSLAKGEVHFLFGPNGAGKSSLLRAIMGLPKYEVKKGSILFEGEDITSKKAYERARMGIALAYQTPPPLQVRFQYVAKLMARKYRSRLDELSGLHLENLLHRKLHNGFSGGESKRAELGIVLLQKPKLAMLDEPDSGVDLDSMELVAGAINKLIKNGCTVLVVSHTGFIAWKMKRIDRASVMIDGRIVYRGKFEEVYEIIAKEGYRRFTT